MRIVSVAEQPLDEVRFLNAGRGPADYYEDRLPILLGEVDALPPGIDAIVATADLQGRQCLQDARGQPLRLLGEVLPRRLSESILPMCGLTDLKRVGVLLAGDFYTLPALEARGGTGDVTAVWYEFSRHFAWVAGVAGNHDTFGSQHADRPRPLFGQHYLDGDICNVAGLRIAGIGGIIGNPRRIRRRTDDQYLDLLATVMQEHPKIVILHEGPDGPACGQRGSARIRDVLESYGPTLVVRGNTHWSDPMAQLANETQVLNVDSRVVVLRLATSHGG